MGETGDEVDPIIARIEREAGVPDLLKILTERLEPTDLQSLLLKVQQLAAQRITPERLLQRFRDDRFVWPAATNPVAMVAFEQLAFASLPDGYTPLALSPLCPLGTCAAVATVDQNKVVATIRNSEVISDPTNVLALESALRRRALHCQADGKWSEIGDGGVTDWTQKLLSDRKERFLIGCVAPERILQLVK